MSKKKNVKRSLTERLFLFKSNFTEKEIDLFKENYKKLSEKEIDKIVKDFLFNEKKVCFNIGPTNAEELLIKTQKKQKKEWYQVFDKENKNKFEIKENKNKFEIKEDYEMKNFILDNLNVLINDNIYTIEERFKQDEEFSKKQFEKPENKKILKGKKFTDINCKRYLFSKEINKKLLNETADLFIKYIKIQKG